MTNFIHMNRNELSTPIYRYTTIGYVFDLIVNKENTLVPPRKWDDPFENILTKMIFKCPIRKPFRHPLRERCYGQCWTATGEETDAFWRMYTNDFNAGVRIKTTINKLYKSLRRSQSAYSSNSCFIGRVKYIPADDLDRCYKDKEWVKNTFFNRRSRDQAKSLLFKRVEFKPEQEIRLIYLDPHNKVKENHRYKLEASDVIEEIIFHPRMKNNLVKTYTSILNKYDFSGTVVQSQLYQVPQYEHGC